MACVEEFTNVKTAQVFPSLWSSSVLQAECLRRCARDKLWSSNYLPQKCKVTNCILMTMALKLTWLVPAGCLDVWKGLVLCFPVLFITNKHFFAARTLLMCCFLFPLMDRQILLSCLLLGEVPIILRLKHTTSEPCWNLVMGLFSSSCFLN